jgi:hypothetical protein
MQRKLSSVSCLNWGRRPHSRLRCGVRQCPAAFRCLQKKLRTLCGLGPRSQTLDFAVWNWFESAPSKAAGHCRTPRPGGDSALIRANRY